ncbi:hypothetical protein ACHAPT_000446 [Fusarium lateritium]
MYIKKLTLLVAALGASLISAAPSPERTFKDIDEIGSLSTDVVTAVERMPVLGYDASSVHDLFSATASLLQGSLKINEANADVEVEEFDDQQKGNICRLLHKAERISQFPLTPVIGNLLDSYNKEMTKLLDEVNSRLDDCSDAYKQRLEDAIKTARAQYAATDSEA